MLDPMPRKLVAVLYADVASYSRLMGEDEDSTHATLTSYLDFVASCIEAHGGAVMHYAGDAVLARFESATNALTGAIEIQAELRRRNLDLSLTRRMNFRIGINLADVIYDRGEIYGNGVNVAARLEGLAEPGGICVSQSVYSSVRTRLPIEFDDMGEQHVKNIVEPLRVYRVVLDSETIQEVHLASPVAKESAAGGSKKPSIAVLPFLNLSDDSSQSFLADGFTEDLITELSRFHSLSVISRTSSFVFRNTATNVTDIGTKLGVEYVVEGSVRKFGDNLRITAQLIESQSGSHSWADRFECPAVEIFSVQDEIITQIVGTLETQIVHERLLRIARAPLESLQAYDSWLEGHRLMEQWEPDTDAKAVEYFEHALSLDPNFARPYASLAGIYSSRPLLLPGSRHNRADLDRAAKYARRSLELDPLDGKVHMHLAWVHLLNRKFNHAAASFRTARRLNPNDADIAIALALGMSYAGELEYGREMANAAVKANPLHPEYYLGYHAVIEFLGGNFEKAVSLMDQMTEVHPPDFWVWYAAACSEVDEMDEARRAIDRFTEQVKRDWVGSPQSGPKEYVEWFFKITPLSQEDIGQQLVEALQRAGADVSRHNRLPVIC